ncbi:MAG TPA: hypothetical protein VLL54_15560 [Pyrinomonadaceae bacterium]|nr:hypothetical protein [Pyrinomonadaceae bacterium]
MPDLQRLIKIAEEELSHTDPSPFSSSAFDRVKEKISEYTVELITESVKVARRHDSDSVSPSYVDRASEYLISQSGSKTYRHLGTIGGILLGAVGSNVLSMITTRQFTLGGIVVTVVLTLVGSFLVAVNMVKD